MVPEQLPQGRRRVATVTGPSGKTVRYCMIDDVQTLLWAVNLGTIEFHPFLARATDPDRLLVLALDLDPGPPAGLAECCAVALALRDLLAPLQSLVKTSGAKGLHVYALLNGSATFAQTKAFARELARRLPELATDRRSRSARAGKVLIDWGQNDPQPLHRRALVASGDARAAGLDPVGVARARRITSRSRPRPRSSGWRRPETPSVQCSTSCKRSLAADRPRWEFRPFVICPRASPLPFAPSIRGLLRACA